MWEKTQYLLQMKDPPIVEVPGNALENMRRFAANMSSYYERPAFWISNGFLFFQLHRPNEIQFRFLNKVRLWFAVRRVLKMNRNVAGNETVKMCLKHLDKVVPPASANKAIDYDTLSEEIIDYSPGGWA